MGRRRELEEMPRLLAALGLDGPDGFDRSRVDPSLLSERERASLDHWVPTRGSLNRAAAASEPSGAGPATPGPADRAATRGRSRRRSAVTDESLGRARAVPDPARPALPTPRAGRHRRPLPSGPVVAVPAGLRGAQRRVSLRVVVLVLAVVAVVTLVLVGRVLQARAAAAPHPVTPGGGSTASGGPLPGTSGAPSGVVSRTATAFGSAASTAAGSTLGTAAATGPGSTAPASSGALVVVHVVGQVRRPGVVRLAAGSRVADAVAAAGGARPSADLSAVNLARPLVDGEQVRVPKPGETLTPPVAAGGPSGAGGTPASGGTSATLVNLNTADLATLDTLPGVGPVLAQRILDWRSEHGRFSSVEELGEVSGIGEKMLAQLTPKVTL